MILCLLALAMIGLIAYLWGAQGLFSALIHFLCVVIAGAVAFAAWEPLVYGLLLGVKKDLAWCVGLIVPFLVTLALLRLATNKLIPKGLDLDTTTNFVGGLVFGGLSGFLAVGILTTSIGYVRLPSEILGYKPLGFDASGSLVRKSGMFVPVDAMTVKFFETLSVGAFSTDTPLAVRAPNAHEQAASARLTYGDTGVTAILPGDFDVVGRYTITADSVSDLLSDSANPTPQKAVQLSGEPYPAKSTIEGYIINFKAGAKEKGGQVIVGPGQFRLIVHPEDGAATGLAPIAAIGRAEAHSFNLGRWRFDNQEPYYGSVGGASESRFAVEFVVPPGMTADRDLYVRLCRVAVPEKASVVFASAAERDAAVKAHSSAFEAIAKGELAEAPTTTAVAPSTGPAQDPIRLTDRIPGTANRTDISGLDLDKDNKIVDGEATLTANQMASQGIDFNLRVERFAQTNDTWIVQVDVSVNSKLSFLGKAAQAAQGVVPPVLVDSLGQRYEAVGYIWEQGSQTKIRFKPGEPIRGLSTIPSLSSARPNEKLILVFRVSAGTQIVRFALGDQTIESLNPPLQIPPGRR